MHRILVIDDEELIRVSLSSILEQAGYTVGTARDGNEGILMNEANPFDVVITDIIMPGMEGLETLMKFRSTDNKMPIITMSGGGHAGNLDFLKSSQLLGANAILAKPFTVDELLTTVAHVLGKEE